MCMLAKLGGCFALVPATILLTISFFVLTALQKTLPNKLKAFGFIVVLLLWVSAAMIFSAGIYGSKVLPASMHSGMQNTQN